MTHTVTIFDNQAKPKYGAKFNGSIEDTDTYETIGYLDFLHPSAFYKKLSDAEKKVQLDLVCAAEKEDAPVYLSTVKSPVDRLPIENAMAVLIVKGEGLFSVIVKLNGEFGDEVWPLQHGNTKNRYVGFDNAERKNKLGARIAA